MSLQEQVGQQKKLFVNKPQSKPIKNELDSMIVDHPQTDFDEFMEFRQFLGKLQDAIN
jgi:hypothetical protein